FLLLLFNSCANFWQWHLFSSGSGNNLHWQWELILPVRTLNLAVGMPCAFYSQQMGSPNNPSLNPTPSTNLNPKGRNRRRSKQRIEELNLEELSPPIVTMANQRTMAQLLQAPTEGYEDAIVIVAITADNFELKHGLLTLVQNKQFFRHDKEDPHAHIRYFNKITSTLKFPNIPNTEAWDRFKDLIRACPHHGFLELHQLDTFYNALNSKDQDSLNFAAGGNFLDHMPRECLAIIESKSKVRYSRNKPVVSKVSMNTSTSGISLDVAELTDMVKALLLDKKSQNQASAIVKAVEESCVTCGGAHSYRNCPATNGNVYRDNIQEFVSQASAVNYYQGNTSYPPAYQAPAPQTQGVLKEDFSAYVKANDAVMRNMQIQGQNMQNQLTNLTDLLTKFMNSNNASTSSSGTLPSNTIPNPRSDLKAITTRSGVSYDGPKIPPSPFFLPKVVENEPEATKDTVTPPNNRSTEDVQPLVVQTKTLEIQISKPVAEPVIAQVSASKPNPKSSIPYPSRRNDERNHEKANNQIEKFYQIFKETSFEISFADALILMHKFASTLKALIENKEKLSEMARTPLTLADLGAIINLMPLSMWERLSLPELTPTYFDVDPRVPLILRRSFLKTRRALINVFEGKPTLCVGKEDITFNLDQTSRYSANYNDNSINQINVIEMASEEYSQEVLGFSDMIASGNPTPYYDPNISTTSSTLTPFGNSDFLLEEVDAFLAIEDEPTLPKVDQYYFDSDGGHSSLRIFPK
nr:hypothetical protein [Tanacetum cinerariifolium]